MRSAADDEEDVNEDLDESLEAEVPTAKVVQRQGRPLLRVWPAADDEEEVDEDLDESPGDEVPAATAGEEGDEALDDNDLYADLEDFTRPPDVAEGWEGDGSIPSELEIYLRTSKSPTGGWKATERMRGPETTRAGRTERMTTGSGRERAVKTTTGRERAREKRERRERKSGGTGSGRKVDTNLGKKQEKE